MGNRPSRTSGIAQPERGLGSPRAGGFSLIDVLVTMAVMMVLMSLLSPALLSAQESARRVRCASNMRQIGMAIQMYTADHNGRVPPALYGVPPPPPPTDRNRRLPPPPAQPEWSGDTMFARLPAVPEIRAAANGTWDGLGYLYPTYLTHPGALYCPSHRGQHPFLEYTDDWIAQNGLIAANYQYRVPPASLYLSDMDPRTSLVADGMMSKSDYNHKVGNNTLKADLTVSWFSDFNGAVYKSLPDVSPKFSTRQMGRARAWDTLDGFGAKF